jgi:hypothetical protein
VSRQEITLSLLPELAQDFLGREVEEISVVERRCIITPHTDREDLAGVLITAARELGGEHGIHDQDTRTIVNAVQDL